MKLLFKEGWCGITVESAGEVWWNTAGWGRSIERPGEHVPIHTEKRWEHHTHCGETTSENVDLHGGS